MDGAGLAAGAVASVALADSIEWSAMGGNGTCTLLAMTLGARVLSEDPLFAVRAERMAARVLAIEFCEPRRWDTPGAHHEQFLRRHRAWIRLAGDHGQALRLCEVNDRGWPHSPAR